MLTAIYRIRRDGTANKDLGADHFHRSPEVQAHRLAKQIAKPGFTCTSEPKQTEAVSI